MYKWYLLKGYKPYWNNLSTALPEKHIEQIVDQSEDDLIYWEELNKPAIDWKFPMEEALLQTNNDSKPYYLKCSDGKQNFYFYFDRINNTASEYKEDFYYDCIYTLDKYMTYFYNKLQILLNNKVNVNHINKFSNRLDYTVDTEGKLKSFTFDILKNKQFGNTININNNQMVREFIYGTNENSLWSDNFKNTPIPTEVQFKLWSSEETKNSITWNNFTKANDRKRYGYIVAKSSCLQSGTSTPSKKFTSHAKNTKIIIPLFNDNANYVNELFKGLLNFDPTIEQTSLVNALSDSNFISFFECDIPYSLWYGESQKENSQVELKYGINKIDNTTSYNVYFFEIPTNYAPKWTIINYADYDNGFDGKIKDLVLNFNYWLPNTEPTLLNPSYYQERCYLDNGKYISTDASLIKYEIQDIDTISNFGLNLKAYFLFDSDLHIVYDYENFNNTLNPIWNNKESNIRTELGTPNGVYGSAAASYYTNNANSLITGLANRRDEQTNSWVKSGFDTLGNYTNAFKDFATLNVGGFIKDISHIITGNTATAYKNIIANRQLASEIHNIQSSANTTLVNPYTDAAIPNKEIVNNDKTYTLFNTYANTLHPWSKDIMFRYILANGYPFNKVDSINSYDNRQYMNVLQVDTSYNFDNLIHVLTINDNTIYGNINYNVEFLSWLSNLHRFYKTIDIINVLDYTTEDYINNVEKDIPIIPTSKININTLITNTNIDYSTEIRIWEHITELNPNLPSDLYENLIITQYENSITIQAKSTSDKYYGVIIFTCTKLPDILDLTQYLEDRKELPIIKSANSKENNANIWIDPKIAISNFNIDIPTITLIKNYGNFNYEFSLKTNIAYGYKVQNIQGSNILSSDWIITNGIVPHEAETKYIASKTVVYPIGGNVTFFGSDTAYCLGYDSNLNLGDKTLQNVFNLTTDTISIKLDLENKNCSITLSDWIETLPESVTVKYVTNQLNIDYSSFVSFIEKLELTN